MTAALLVDTTSQLTARLGGEQVEVGLNQDKSIDFGHIRDLYYPIHLNVDVDERVVVQNIASLSLEFDLFVAHQDSFELRVVAVELVVEKAKDPSVDRPKV